MPVLCFLVFFVHEIMKKMSKVNIQFKIEVSEKLEIEYIKKRHNILLLLLL